MHIFLISLVVFLIMVGVFLKQPKFGKLPSGERLQRIKKSPNYKNGSFQNVSHTPDLAEGVTYHSLIKEFLFKKRIRVSPTDTLPSVKTDLLNLDTKADILVWFGHSSYFLQIDGKRILMDPVFSGSASPFSFAIKAFAGTNPYSVDDIPEIDFLFISHDHWDHLDYGTIKKLRPKIRKVICGLGVGEHFEAWGYKKELIVELDWNENIDLGANFMVNTTSARHFSGRGFSRNKSLWLSYVLQTPTIKIFLGGDSGYDSHFAEIGDKFGPFDLAILENGQYDYKWKYIHMLPDEILKAAQGLKAKSILPVHSGKFALANHSWDEPLEMIVQNSDHGNLNVITPKIGEQVSLKDASQKFEYWWRNVN